jgi:hypothetical protein
MMPRLFSLLASGFGEPLWRRQDSGRAFPHASYHFHQESITLVPERN